MKQRVTKPMVNKWIERNTEILDGHYVSKVDQSKVVHTDLLDNGYVKYLVRYGINDLHAVDGVEWACVGLSEDDGKWYGWSRSHIYGFEVGSSCEKTHIHYKPADKEGFMELQKALWVDPKHLNLVVDDITEKGFAIKWDYSDDFPEEKLRGTKGYVPCNFPEEYGKGEWVAETMDDAHQMAIDFATRANKFS